MSAKAFLIRVGRLLRSGHASENAGSTRSKIVRSRERPEKRQRPSARPLRAHAMLSAQHVKHGNSLAASRWFSAEPPRPSMPAPRSPTPMPTDRSKPIEASWPQRSAVRLTVRTRRQCVLVAMPCNGANAQRTRSGHLNEERRNRMTAPARSRAHRTAISKAWRSKPPIRAGITPAALRATDPLPSLTVGTSVRLAGRAAVIRARLRRPSTWRTGRLHR